MFCVSFCIGQETPAEIKSGEYFLYLQNETLLKEGNYEEKEKFSKFVYSHLNGDKIKLKDIRFFRNVDGYFGVYTKNNGNGKGVRLIREREGAFELFYKSRNWKNDLESRSAFANKKSYYSKNYGEIKKLKYKNVLEDMQFDGNDKMGPKQKVILEHLAKAKKQKRFKGIALGVGIAGCIAGYWMIITDDSQQNIRGLLVGGVGLAGLTVSRFLGSQIELKRAIGEYNSL